MNQLVVGSQAILYADDEGRRKIAMAMNRDFIRRYISSNILGRDHHDVSAG